MKYYKIGKVSKLFGVSCETIRNYEKTGLIRSTTPPDSSVRYYDIDNVRKLVGIRTMRNQGFSVSELEQVYSDMSLEEYDELMRQKIAADECELRRVEIRLAERRRAAEEVMRVRSGRMQAELMHYHGGFYLPYHGNDILHTDVTKTGCANGRRICSMCAIWRSIQILRCPTNRRANTSTRSMCRCNMWSRLESTWCRR